MRDKVAFPMLFGLGRLIVGACLIGLLGGSSCRVHSCHHDHDDFDHDHDDCHEDHEHGTLDGQEDGRSTPRDPRAYVLRRFRLWIEPSAAGAARILDNIDGLAVMDPTFEEFSERVLRANADLLGLSLGATLMPAGSSVHGEHVRLAYQRSDRADQLVVLDYERDRLRRISLRPRSGDRSASGR